MRFFLIDRITKWEVPEAAEAIKNVALSEDFFDDHFPRRPIMPGVLMLEGMAQLSGLLLEASLQEKFQRNAKAILTVVERTKFRQLVRPGDTLAYRAEMAVVAARLAVEDAGMAPRRAYSADEIGLFGATGLSGIRGDPFFRSAVPGPELPHGGRGAKLPQRWRCIRRARSGWRADDCRGHRLPGGANPSGRLPGPRVAPGPSF